MTVERHWFAFCSEFEVTGQFIRYHTPKLRKPFTLWNSSNTEVEKISFKHLLIQTVPLLPVLLRLYPAGLCLVLDTLPPLHLPLHFLQHHCLQHLPSGLHSGHASRRRGGWRTSEAAEATTRDACHWNLLQPQVCTPPPTAFLSSSLSKYRFGISMIGVKL